MRKFKENYAVKLSVKCRQTIRMLAVYKFLPQWGKVR